MTTTFVPLEELCRMDRRNVHPSDPEAAHLPFVGVEHVSAGSGIIDLDSDSRVGSQKSASLRFDERHVLYGKLRPYLNKVATPSFSGRCSTELIPLLPRDGVNRDFLAHVLRQRETVDFAMASVTGARMPRTDMKVLMAMTVPLPSLDEQHRIVALLSRAARIESLRARAATKLDDFVRALFVRTFGGPREISKRYQCEALRDVAQIASGATKGRRIAPADRADVPYLRVANVQDGVLDLGEMKTIAIRRGEIDKYALAVGDLVMTEGGDIDKLGRTAVWNGELHYCAHQNHVFRVRPNRALVLSDYLRGVAGSEYGKSYFLSVAKRTTGIASINKTQLGGLPVPLPPLELQTQYSHLTAKARAIALQAEAAAAKTAALSNSVMASLLSSEGRACPAHRSECTPSGAA